MEKMSKSHEDYLEAIVMLGGTTEVSVRSVDIANKMGVSKASVNKAVTALKEKALAEQPYYGDVTLTEAGFAYEVPAQGAWHSRRRCRERSLPYGTRHQRRLVREMESLY